MPKGQRFDGKWNFHTKRYLCEKCNRKGLYISGNRAWIKCMYCKDLMTQEDKGYSDRMQHIKVLTKT